MSPSWLDSRLHQLRSIARPRTRLREVIRSRADRKESLIDSRISNLEDEAARKLALLSRSTAEMVLPIPPPEIRYRVVNRPESRLTHLETGLEVNGSIESALNDVGVRLANLQDVLDWGCGCCRVTRHWAPLFGSVSFTGCDIDEVSVAWSRRHLGDQVHFEVTGGDPPLPFPSAQFDLILGASVFSHLEEAKQQAWLPELVRVTRPGGFIVLSVHGRAAFEANRWNLPEEVQREFERSGYVHLANIRDDVLPDWYQTTFQDEAHVQRTFTPILDVVRHDPGGHCGQDLVLCRRRDSTGD